MIIARFAFLWTLLLFVGCSFPVFAGEVKPKVTMRAVVPNREEDYQLFIASVPEESVLPGQDITYTIIYGCLGWNETPELELTATWSFPEAVVVEFVSGSARNGFGGVSPNVTFSEAGGHISWQMSNFPPRAVSQQVSFKLRVGSQSRSAGTFPIEVRAQLDAPVVTKEATSVIMVAYLEEVVTKAPLLIWRYLRGPFEEPALRILFLVFLFLALGWFWWKRACPVWGVVYSTDSSRPVFLARISVYDFSGRQLGMVLTNKRGEFGFRLAGESYLVEVTMRGFVISTVSEGCLVLSDSRFVIFLQKPQERVKPAMIYLRKCV